MQMPEIQRGIIGKDLFEVCFVPEQVMDQGRKISFDLLDHNDTMHHLDSLSYRYMLVSHEDLDTIIHLVLSNR